MTLDRGVPRWRAQWVLMDLTARSFGSNQKPPVRRHVLFRQELVKVFVKIFWSLIITLHCMSFWMLLKRALKQVKGWVIPSIKDILHVLLHGNFEFSTRIALSDFEPWVAKSVDETVHSPRISPRPVVSNALNYDRLRAKLKSVDKVVFWKGVILNPLDSVLKMRQIYSFVIFVALFCLHE